jgi:hypothetical protein
MANDTVWASQGATSETVTTVQNVTDEMTPIVQITGDRGTFTRLLNRVSKGSAPGLPHYMTLKDGADAFLPTGTKLQYELQKAGNDNATKVSEKVTNISFWNNNTPSEQANVDKIDRSKIQITRPEVLGGEPVESIDVRGQLDTLLVKINSAAQIDWTNSEFEIDPEALESHDL